MDHERQKDQEICKLKEQMEMLVHHVITYKNELDLFRQQYGGRWLTKEEREKIEELQKWMHDHPGNDGID